MISKDSAYLSPSELLEKYPESPFTIENIGRLLRLKLIRGFYKGDVTQVSEQSFLNLVDYRNTVIESEMLKLRKNG